MRLHDWETLLRPYLASIELVGEIHLERGQRADLERVFEDDQQLLMYADNARLRAESQPRQEALW